MLGKLFGEKKGGYYLELSEEEINAVPEPPAAPAAPAAPQAEAPAAVPTEAGGEAAAAPPAKAAAPVQAVASSVSKAAAAMPQEAATPTPMADTQELIRAAIAAASQSAQASAENVSEPFDYRMPVASAGRRRPGPSMSPFKGMAKDMKRTKSGF